LTLIKVIGKHKTAVGALGLTALLLPVIIFGIIFPDAFPDRDVAAYISGTPDTVVPGTPASVDLGLSQPIPSRVNLDVVMVIDVSGSMQTGQIPGGSPFGIYKIDAAQYAMETLINSSEEGDRIGIVAFSNWASLEVEFPDLTFPVSPWFGNDAINLTNDILYINSSDNLQALYAATDRVDDLDGWTDVYAGLYKGLDMLLAAESRPNTLRTIILLTDGKHNHGPYSEYGNYSGSQGSDYRDPEYNSIPSSWVVDYFTPNVGNYTGFIGYNETTPFSPVLNASMNGISVNTIGLAHTGVQYDPAFLGNISQVGGGEFFEANNTFSLVNAFLKIREQAAGWSNFHEIDDTSLISQGDFINATWFNVTETTDKIKVILNWNDTSADLDLVLYAPNGDVIIPEVYAPSNMIYNVTGAPSYVIIENPMLSNWTFAVNGTNVSGQIRYFVMASEFIPPLEISEITTPLVSEDLTKITFNVTLKNTNANKTLENIQILLNTTLNYSVSSGGFSLTPGQTIVLSVNINSSIVLLENVTIDEFTLVEVKSGEGYFDAVGMRLSLSSDVDDTDIPGTLPGKEKGLIESLPGWYAFVAAAIAAGAVLGVLAIYIKIKEIQFLNFLERFKEAFGGRSRRIAEGLAAMGAVGVSEREVRRAMDESTSADEFKERIEERTGTALSVEEFVLLSAGVASLDALRVQLEKVYGKSIPAEEFQDIVSTSKSLEDMRKKLEAVMGVTITEEMFISIVSGDIMEVTEMQEMFAKLVKPEVVEVIKEPIVSIEEIDIEGFRRKMRELFKP